MPTFEKPPSSRPAIKDAPLPQAADSLYDQLFDQLLGKEFLWFVAVVVAAVFTFIHWIQYLHPVPPTRGSAIFMTIATLGLAILAFFKIRRAFRLADQIKLGIHGEKYISQYLHRTCTALGYR